MKKNYLYEVAENPFHGGRHIAYANTLETAIRSAFRHDICTGRGCLCGGPSIRNADGTSLSNDDLDKMIDLRNKMRNR